MATYRKRGNKWRAEVCKNSVRFSATFATKIQAKEWAAVTESGIVAQNSTSLVSSQTLGDAFERYANEVSPNKKGARWEIIRLKLLKRYEFSEISLAKLSSSDIALWRDQRLCQVAPSSVNRELNIISSVLTIARLEWHWIDKNPVSDIKRPRNPKSRDRRISEKEIQCVLDALGYDNSVAINNKKQLVAVLFLTALETAMRLGELCALTPEDINLDDRFVVLRDSKNNDTRRVPLSRQAVYLFEKVLLSGLVIDSGVASSTFRKACRQSKIENLRFHDTRHESLTRLARKLDVLDLARMVGHRDPRSLMIYYNATATEIAERLD